MGRSNYAYGMLRAADLAHYFGAKETTVIEFGVASGAGLLNLIELGEMITAETGVRFRVVGFDTGTGLPTVSGYRDHAELWMPGDFAMEGSEELLERLGGRAELVLGDIAHTIVPFMETLSRVAPIGFVSVDVDIYTATKSALKILGGPPEMYVPAVSMYFDDVSFYFANEWCGELLAIREFNAEHELRKIGPDRSLPGRRKTADSPWHRQMFACHILDHHARNEARDRNDLSIGDHHRHMSANFLY
ncbi:MAG: hypothetical protein MJD61_07650 [Proteobacteria bacterium]|nr:hypothetical protein [Pseudomonadota bacterium]